MKRSPLQRKQALDRREALNTRAPLKRGRGFAASETQRKKCRDGLCVVCGRDRFEATIHPAHLIDRSLCPQGADDPRAVVPLCAEDHRRYDSGEISLLEYLEPRFRVELGFAVERFGLVNTLRRVTNDREAGS